MPSISELEHALTLGIETASVFPVVCGSATAEVASTGWPTCSSRSAPPADRPTIVAAGDTEVEVSADPDGDVLAFAFATSPTVRRQVTLLKVLSERSATTTGW